MDNQSAAPITMNFSKATLIAGTTTTFTNTGTTTFAIRGKFYTKTAMTNAASPTTDWSTGNAFLPVLANQGSIYMVGFDSTGAVRVIQGTIVALDGIVSSNKFIVYPQFGGMGGPAGSGSTNFDFCPIGYVVIQCLTTFVTAGGFLLGTTSWTATGVTATFVDVCGWPDRPQGV